MKTNNVTFGVDADGVDIYIDGNYLTSVCGTDIEDDAMECMPKSIQKHFGYIKTIIIDGKEIELSSESFENLKRSLNI